MEVAVEACNVGVGIAGRTWPVPVVDRADEHILGSGRDPVAVDSTAHCSNHTLLLLDGQNPQVLT